MKHKAEKATEEPAGKCGMLAQCNGPHLHLWLQGSQWQGNKGLARSLPQVPIGVRLLHAGLTAQQLSDALHATVPLLRLPGSLQGQAGCSFIHLTEACLTNQVQVLHTRDPVGTKAPSADVMTVLT